MTEAGREETPAGLGGGAVAAGEHTAGDLTSSTMTPKVESTNTAPRLGESLPGRIDGEGHDGQIVDPECEAVLMAQFDLSPADLATYRPEIPEPADFDDFWRKTLEETAGHDLAPTFEPYDALLPGVAIYDVRYTGYGGQ